MSCQPSGPMAREAFGRSRLRWSGQRATRSSTRSSTGCLRPGPTRADGHPKLARILGPGPSSLPMSCRSPPTRCAPLATLCAPRWRLGISASWSTIRRSAARPTPKQCTRARVATRRLRSDLRTFRPLLPPDWYTSTTDELRWLGQSLGAVRDADVLLDRLDGAARDLDVSDRGAAKQLLSRLEERADQRDALLAAMDSDRYGQLLDRLAAAARELPPGGDRKAQAARAARRRGGAAPALAAVAPLRPGAGRAPLRRGPPRGADPRQTPALRQRGRRPGGRPARDCASPAPVADLQGVLGDMHDCRGRRGLAARRGSAARPPPGAGRRPAHRPASATSRPVPGRMARRRGGRSTARSCGPGCSRVRARDRPAAVYGRQPVRIAAFDLGSNSFHLLVADAHPDGTFEPLVTRQGDAPAGECRRRHRGDRRRPPAAPRWRSCAASGPWPSPSRPTRSWRAARAALREARDSAAVVDRIEAETGVKVRVISGREEARLIFGAVRASVVIDPGPALALDLGGGSLELMVGDAQRHGLVDEPQARSGPADRRPGPRRPAHRGRPAPAGARRQHRGRSAPARDHQPRPAGG